MPIEILMPALSPTMKEGNLAKWLKKEGDKIKAGEVIAEIETDKATMEVEAVDEGVLGKIVVAAGTENVPVNSLIALLLDKGEDAKMLEGYAVAGSIKADAGAAKVSTPPLESLRSSLSPKNDHLGHFSSDSSPQGVYDKASSNLTQHKEAASQDNQGSKASPLAKRIARENNVVLSQINGSGPRGRIVKDDILGFVNQGGASQGMVRRNLQEFSVSKNNNVRKVIAKRLLESKQSVPHFYLSCDLQIDKLLELRVALNSAAAGHENGTPAYKISVNDLVIKAVALALKKVPQANSSWSDDAILLYNNIDISVAVAIDGGLITPIIRNADQKTIVAISNEMKQLAKKAKEGKLQPEEFQGGGFSISNLGMFGIDNFNAIVNPPQSCILAVGRGVEKPIISHGEIEIATIMNVTLSSDHRSVDGAVGAEFLKALRNYVENPILMLI